jgi:hypothetical protein
MNEANGILNENDDCENDYESVIDCAIFFRRYGDFCLHLDECVYLEDQCCPVC